MSNLLYNSKGQLSSQTSDWRGIRKSCEALDAKVVTCGTARRSSFSALTFTALRWTCGRLVAY